MNACLSHTRVFTLRKTAQSAQHQTLVSSLLVLTFFLVLLLFLVLTFSLDLDVLSCLALLLLRFCAFLTVFSSVVLCFLVHSSLSFTFTAFQTVLLYSVQLSKLYFFTMFNFPNFTFVSTLTTPPHLTKTFLETFLSPRDTLLDDTSTREPRDMPLPHTCTCSFPHRWSLGSLAQTSSLLPCSKRCVVCFVLCSVF